MSRDQTNVIVASQAEQQQKNELPPQIGAGHQTQQQQEPIPFNEALGYLNRIKVFNLKSLLKNIFCILGTICNPSGCLSWIFEHFEQVPTTWWGSGLQVGLQFLTCQAFQRLTEADVYKAVARLFQNERDLMNDFKSFLPDAKLELPAAPTEPPIQQNDQQQTQRNSVESAENEQAQAQPPVGPPPPSANAKVITVASVASGKRQLAKENSTSSATKVTLNYFYQLMSDFFFFRELNCSRHLKSLMTWIWQIFWRRSLSKTLSFLKRWK